MRICSSCGAELEDLNPRFCGECGEPILKIDSFPAKVSVSTSSTDSSTEATTSLSTLRSAVASQRPDVQPHAGGDDEEVAEPSHSYNHRRQEDASAAIRSDPSRVASPNGFQKTAIALEINRNRFYMEGRSGVLELRVENISNRDATIAFSVESPLCAWIGSATRDNIHLPAHGKKAIRIQMRPSSSGEVVLAVTVECKAGSAISRFTAEPMIRILETTATPQNLSITIDQSLKSNGDVYAASMRSQADDMLKKGIIRSNNDLLERTFDDDWQPVDLHDWNVGENSPVQIISSLSRLAPTRDKVLLLLRDQWVSSPNILLLSHPIVRIGRSREANEIVLRFLPRSTANDEKSASISREHVAIAIEDEGLFLIDKSGSHETRLDGHPVVERAAIPLNRPSIVEVAGVFQLRLIPGIEHSEGRNTSGHQYSQFGKPDRVWLIAERLGIRSLLVERVSNLANDECYIIVYRWANIGCAAGNEMTIPGAGLEDVHARVVRLGSQFWLHAVATDAIVVDGVPIPKGSICPLAAGLPILLAGISGEIAEFKQKGL